MKTKKIKDKVQISRFVAQADVLFTDITSRRVKNDEKIASTCIQLLQESFISAEMDPHKLRNMAVEKLQSKFIKYGLVVSENSSYIEKVEIEKKQELAIRQEISKTICNLLPSEFIFDYNEFIESLNIKDTRPAVIFKMLSSFQNKKFYQWKQAVIDDNFEISYHLNQTNAIPTIGIVISPEGEALFESYDGFIASNKKNKMEYVKGIKLSIDRQYIATVIGLSKDFITYSRVVQEKFTSIYAYRLYLLLLSIYRVQHETKFNKYSFQALQKKFGTNYKNIKNFRAKVLAPSLDDLNTYTDYIIQLIERKENGEIYFSFSMKKKDVFLNSDLRFGVGKTFFYIASRIYYFSNEKIKNLEAFARYLEQKHGGTLVQVYHGREFIEWEKESEIAYKREDKIIALLKDNPKLSKYVYDKKMMCIREEVIIDGESKMMLIEFDGRRITNPIESYIFLLESSNLFQ